MAFVKTDRLASEFRVPMLLNVNSNRLELVSQIQSSIHGTLTSSSIPLRVVIWNLLFIGLHRNHGASTLSERFEARAWRGNKISVTFFALFLKMCAAAYELLA